MDAHSVRYSVKTATEGELRAHLTLCASGFSPPLDERVELGEYARKLFERAVTFEAWVGTDLLGLVAAYLNGDAGAPGYITSVSVAPVLVGRGIAQELMTRCLARARAAGVPFVSLEVSRASVAARRLYEKLGFDVTDDRGATLAMMLRLS